MTKFEKTAKRAELLGHAYQTIIDRDLFDNYEDSWSDNPTLIEGKNELHEFYMSVAKEIEKLL